MASAAEMGRMIGRRGLAALSASGGAEGVLRVAVTVRDVRERFGKLDLLVTPVAGVGEAWVSEGKVELAEEASSDG